MSVITTAASVTVAYGALAAATRAAAAQLNGRPGHPMSDHLLLTATAEGLTVRGTGADGDVVHTVPAETLGADWQAAVHGRNLVALLRAALSGSTPTRMHHVPVTVARTDGGLSVTIGDRAAITMPSPTIDVSEWPTMPEPTDAVIRTTRDELLAAVKATVYATDHKTARSMGMPILAAVEFAVSGGELTVAATDRYRLAVTGPIPVTELTPTATTSALPDGRALLAVARSLPAGPVTLALSVTDGAEVSPTLLITAPGVTASLTSTTSQYMRWQRLFPTSFGAEFEVDRRALQAAVELQATVARNVLLVLAADGLRVEASGQDAGEGNPDVSGAAPQVVRYTQPPTGSAPSVLINPAFLVAALKAVTSDTVAVAFDARDTRPIMVTPADGMAGQSHRALIMPARKAG